MSDHSFREVQRFRQRWLWAVLGGSAVVVLFAGPAAWPAFFILGAVGAFVYAVRLRTEVRADGIYYRLWPLHQSFRRIEWAEIERYESGEYGPIREFGGWGIRWLPGKIAYTVSGSQGVRIERTDGQTVLIGTQQPEAFADAIEAAIDR